MKGRPVGDARLQRKLRLETEQIRLHPVTAQHRWQSDVRDHVPLLSVNGKHSLPFRSIQFRIAELDGKPYLGSDPLAGGTEFP